jgi:cysteine-rich repeat protein
MRATLLLLALTALAGALGCNALLGLEDGKPRPEPGGGGAGGGAAATTGEGGSGGVATCGDGLVELAEACDDGGTDEGDGCSASCQVEHGYTCQGEPSVCTVACGDGVLLGGEGCDDGNVHPGDGCSPTCTVEPGYTCQGVPSVCATVCGDGVIAGLEACDDGDDEGGDGCTACAIDPGFACEGAPSVCTTTCGDGVVAGLEACDDGDGEGGDGCTACAIDAGFACSGSPSACSPVCGDGIVAGFETCDDGNDVAGDCCSSSCVYEDGCEREPNDDAALANDHDVLASAGLMKATIAPAGDRDVFSITVPDGRIGSLTAWIGDGHLGSTCASDAIDTQIAIAGHLPLASDDDGGPGLCSLATATVLAPGEYTVEVEASDDAPLATFDYTIGLGLALCGDAEVGELEECDDGNLTPGDGCNRLCALEARTESGANGTPALANGPYVPRFVAAGSINPPGDVDVYAIDLVRTADLRIESADGLGPPSCQGIDTVVTLYAPDGATVLATDDDGGPGLCSLIDGAATPAATRLAPGVYFVRIAAKSAAMLIPAYRLVVDALALCGDGFVEGSEACDSTAGCDASCAIGP